MSTLSAGTTLQHGKYRIISTLGQGGFGITYLAENTMLKGKVAIKEFFYKEYCDRDADTRHVTVPTSGNRDVVDRFKQKFVKEARTIFKLPHPNIVRILDVFEENGTAYYVMDYIEGESLSEMVARRGYIPEAEALAYICDVAQALTYIHSKKVNHLDVKPGNMIRRRSDGKVLLIDFGVAKQYDAASLKGTTTTPVCISAGYSPVEQYRKNGVQSFSPQSDVYALAATLYKLLTGVTPPEAMDVQDEGLPVDELMAKQVSQHVRLAIALAMKGKSERTQSVELFIRHLSESSNEETVNLHDQEPKKPQPKPKKPQPKPAPKINQFVKAIKSKTLYMWGIGRAVALALFVKAKKSKSLYIWGIGGAVAIALLIGIIKFSGRSSGGDASAETSDSTAMVDTVPNVVNQTIKLTKGHKTKRQFVYTGEVDAYGLPHGKGKAEYPEIPTYGSSVLEGTFEHGIPTEGEVKYKTGYAFKGTFNDQGMYQEGTWTEKDNYYFTGTFNNGDPYTGTWYNPDGTVYMKIKNGNTE